MRFKRLLAALAALTVARAFVAPKSARILATKRPSTVRTDKDPDVSDVAQFLGDLPAPPVLVPVDPLPEIVVAPVDDEQEAAARRAVHTTEAERRKRGAFSAPSDANWTLFAFQKSQEAAVYDDILDFLNVDAPDEKKAEAPAKTVDRRRVTDVAEGEGPSMVSELSAFTLPLLLVWLSSPLLSLVDTASVGALRATSELAVLGPACALCDNAAFLCTCLGIVTTGAVSRAMATSDEAAARTASAAAMAAATLVGACLTLAAFAGPGAGALGLFLPRQNPFFPEALGYVQARGLSFVPGLLLMVLQSTSLARRNVRAPLRAAAYSACANLAGDALLVPRYGLVGAAAATSVAQCVAFAEMARSAVVGRWLPGTFRSWRAAAGAPLRRLAARGLPVLAALSSKTSVLLGLSYAAAAAATGRGQLAELAAHQILVGLYFVFAPIGDALSQTVQTFLPRSMVADATRGETRAGSRSLGAASRRVVKGALLAALVLGGVDALAATGLPSSFPGLFCGDAVVAAHLKATAPYLGLCLLIHGFSSAMEGTMLGTQDDVTLGTLYAVDAALVVGAFFHLAATAAPLAAIWKTFLGYQVLRSTQFGIRVASTALRRRKRDPDIKLA